MENEPVNQTPGRRPLIGRKFQPGVSGNPAGRKPKQFTLISTIKAELEKIDPDSGLTNEEAIAVALVKLARSGNPKGIDLLMQYTVPKPQVSIGLSGDSDQPLILRILEDGKGY